MAQGTHLPYLLSPWAPALCFATVARPKHRSIAKFARDPSRLFYLGKLNQSPNLRWLSDCRVGNLKCVAHNRRRPRWPWSRFFVQRARILVSHRPTRCLACSPALVAIANNVLKVGCYSAESLSAMMLSGETLTNL